MPSSLRMPGVVSNGICNRAVGCLGTSDHSQCRWQRGGLRHDGAQHRASRPPSAGGAGPTGENWLEWSCPGTSDHSQCQGRRGGLKWQTSDADKAAEYRKRVVALVRAGRSAEDVAQEYEASPRAIRRWVMEADEAQGRGDDGWTKEEQEELRP